MAFLLASEATSSFEAFLSSLRSKLSWFFLGVNVHCVGVPGGSIPGGGRGMEGDRGSGGVLLSDSDHKVTLAKELVNFLVPSFGCGWNYFHAVESV